MTLETKSNVTCKVSLRLLEESAKLTRFDEEMRHEYRIATRICRQHDFIEGVRALLIDKDQKPRWDPVTPEAVTASMVDALFAPLPPEAEWSPVTAGRYLVDDLALKYGFGRPDRFAVEHGARGTWCEK